MGNPILLMKRTREKMDELQKVLASVQRELESARRDLSKFPPLNSSGCNQDDGEKMDCDGEEEKIPEISYNFRYDGNREAVQSHSVQNVSFYPSVGVKMEGDNVEEE